MPPPVFVFPLRQSVFAAWTTRCWSSAPSRRYLCESFTGCLDPYPGGPCGALTRFFPQSFGLPPFSKRSALHFTPCGDFCTARLFEAAVIPLCSGLQFCLPPRSLL